MNLITTLNYFIYAFLAFIIYLLIKSIWKVLPFFSSRFARFDRKLRNDLDMIAIWTYKKLGYKEYYHSRGKTRVKVMARSQKEAYRKFKNYTTNTNRR